MPQALDTHGPHDLRLIHTCNAIVSNELRLMRRVGPQPDRRRWHVVSVEGIARAKYESAHNSQRDKRHMCIAKATANPMAVERVCATLPEMHACIEVPTSPCKSYSILHFAVRH